MIIDAGSVIILSSFLISLNNYPQDSHKIIWMYQPPRSETIDVKSVCLSHVELQGGKQLYVPTCIHKLDSVTGKGHCVCTRLSPRPLHPKVVRRRRRRGRWKSPVELECDCPSPPYQSQTRPHAPPRRSPSHQSPPRRSRPPRQPPPPLPPRRRPACPAAHGRPARRRERRPSPALCRQSTRCGSGGPGGGRRGLRRRGGSGGDGGRGRGCTPRRWRA
jgi:hypothetical protein